MKSTFVSFATLGALSSLCLAGETPIVMHKANTSDGFANARRPISNPTLFDSALPTTNVHPIFMEHRLPNSINTTAGNLGLGGDVQLYALQFEVALNERLSIVATKDGYVDMNPDKTLTKTEGFANLGAGMKYAFILDPEAGTALSGTATLELPTGNSDVLQGEGDGAVNLILSGLQMMDAWQFAGAAGLQAPFNNEQSTEAWMSAHASYEVCSKFIPLVELNWFHVLDSGDGRGNYPALAGGGVPGIVKFEGGDLFNLGAVNSGSNRDLVTAAIGFRSHVTKQVDVGVAYEIPLTNDENSLMQDRITLDLVWKF
jgi:hypothetical protein